MSLPELSQFHAGLALEPQQTADVKVTARVAAAKLLHLGSPAQMKLSHMLLVEQEVGYHLLFLCRSSSSSSQASVYGIKSYRNYEKARKLGH